MIGTDTNWFLNLENPDLDYTFRCNTTRNDSNIIFAGNYPEEYYKDTKSRFYTESHVEELDGMKFSPDGKYFMYKDEEVLIILLISSHYQPSPCFPVRSPLCSLAGLEEVSFCQCTGYRVER